MKRKRYPLLEWEIDPEANTDEVKVEAPHSLMEVAAQSRKKPPEEEIDLPNLPQGQSRPSQ